MRTLAVSLCAIAFGCNQAPRGSGSHEAPLAAQVAPLPTAATTPPALGAATPPAVNGPAAATGASACAAAADDLRALRSIDTDLAHAGFALPVPLPMQSLQSRYFSCVAVSRASNIPCTLLWEPAATECLATLRLFTSAKGAPGDGSWRYTKALAAECAAATTADVCDQVRAALVAGDAARCPHVKPPSGDQPPKVGHPALYCAALASGDPSKCPQDASPDCAAWARRYGLLASGGLPSVAEKGDPDGRAYAAAALGRDHACEGFVDQLQDACLRGGRR